MEAPTRQRAFIWVLGIWSQVLILACTADTFIHWVIFQTLPDNIFTSIKTDMCCFLYPWKTDINVCDICWNDIQFDQQENPVRFGFKKKNYQRLAEEIASVIIAAYDVDTEGHENISLLIVSGISFYRTILQMVKGVMAISGVNKSSQRLHISTLFLALESSHGGSTFAALYKMTSRGRCYCTHRSISNTETESLPPYQGLK